MPHILIPRAHLFGNPSKISARISPDGHLLAWLAPVDGVLNVWVGPSDAPQDARPITNDRKRGIRLYQWTYDGRRTSKVTRIFMFTPSIRGPARQATSLH